MKYKWVGGASRFGLATEESEGKDWDPASTHLSVIYLSRLIAEVAGKLPESIPADSGQEVTRRFVTKRGILLKLARSYLFQPIKEQIWLINSRQISLFSRHDGVSGIYWHLYCTQYLDFRIFAKSWEISIILYDLPESRIGSDHKKSQYSHFIIDCLELCTEALSTYEQISCFFPPSTFVYIFVTHCFIWLIWTLSSPWTRTFKNVFAWKYFFLFLLRNLSNASR